MQNKLIKFIAIFRSIYIDSIEYAPKYAGSHFDFVWLLPHFINNYVNEMFVYLIGMLSLDARKFIVHMRLFVLASTQNSQQFDMIQS